MNPAIVNDLRIFAIALIGDGTEELFHEYLGKSENGIQRRAKLVARRRQEGSPRFHRVQGPLPVRPDPGQGLFLILELLPKRGLDIPGRRIMADHHARPPGM